MKKTRKPTCPWSDSRHKIRFAPRGIGYCDFMDGGRIVEHGAPQQVIDHPQTERLQEFLNSLAAHEFE